MSDARGSATTCRETATAAPEEAVVKISCRIYDRSALVERARRHLVGHGRAAGDAGARMLVPDGDVEAALVVLLDPGSLCVEPDGSYVDAGVEVAGVTCSAAA